MGHISGGWEFALVLVFCALMLTSHRFRILVVTVFFGGIALIVVTSLMDNKPVRWPWSKYDEAIYATEKDLAVGVHPDGYWEGECVKYGKPKNCME